MYKKSKDSLFLPNRIQLIIDPYIDSTNDEVVYNDFKEKLNLFHQILNQSLNYDKVHVIFLSFTKFVYYFPKKIKEFFSLDLCQIIQSFINENIIKAKEIRIVKDSMNLIQYLCTFDLDYIPIFSDNQIINQVISVYLINTHELFVSVTRLFTSLLVNNIPQATSLICDSLFPAANDYCYALQKGIDKEGENICVATSFIYFLSKYPTTLSDEIIQRIFNVVTFQVEWNEKLPLPNSIFVFTLWTYSSLLENYQTQMNYFVTEKMISSLSHLLEDDFIEKNAKYQNEGVNNVYLNLEKNPQRPLLSIYNKLYNSRFSLFPQFVESTSFPRLMDLTKSNDATVALESFSILKTIIIHHPDLVETLVAFGLFSFLKEGLESSFNLKSASYECVLNLLQLFKMPIIVYKTLQNDIFLLSIEYVSIASEFEKKEFVDKFLKAMTIFGNNSWKDNIISYLRINDYIDMLTEICNDLPFDLVSQVKNVLTTQEDDD